jgi:hypothetical protein
MPQCQFPVFCCFCISEKLHRKYSRNWTKQVRKLLFFPDGGQGPNGSRRGARGWPHHRGAWPSPWPCPPMVRPPWYTSDDAPSRIRSLPTENPKTISEICRWSSCRKNTGYHATDPKIGTQGAERGRSWIATKHDDGCLESSNTQCTAERDAELYPGSGPSW